MLPNLNLQGSSTPPRSQGEIVTEDMLELTVSRMREPELLNDIGVLQFVKGIEEGKVEFVSGLKTPKALGTCTVLSTILGGVGAP